MIITTKRIFIQVSLSESEKEEINKIAEDNHKNASEFMREATFEKIRRIKNPELFNNIGVQNFSSELISQLIAKQNEAIELQKLLLEKSKLMDEMNKTLELIHKYSSLQGLTNEKDEIINLLKAHKSMNIMQLIEKTKLTQDTILQIVSDTKTFKLNNGRFSLNG